MTERPASRALPGPVAAVITFLASGSVLVLEIVGLRLIAPYVGITLQTSTAVIGFALAAIAIGAWAGGATADRTDPRRLLAPLMVAGGALIVAVLPLVRFAGELLSGAQAGNVLLLAAVSVVVPAALLLSELVVATALRREPPRALRLPRPGHRRCCRPRPRAVAQGRAGACQSRT